MDWADGPPYPEGSHSPEYPAVHYRGYCLAFVQDAYQYGAEVRITRYGSPKAAWQALAPLKTGIPPRGAYVFYDVISGPYAEYDHVGLSLGEGKVVHAHHEYGPVIDHNYKKLTRGYGGLKYIGWAWPPLSPPIVSVSHTEFAAQGIANGILRYFKERGLTVKAFSPVNLIVTDPDGLKISKHFNEIPGATYSEIDLDGDGDLDDLVRIPDRKIGEYLITVIPEPDALPTDTYTLEVSLFDESIIIAENVQVSEIPPQPYTIISTVTGIIPPTPADTTPPTTTLTIGSPQYTDIGGNVYVTSSTSFTLLATDDPRGSGVASTAYKIRNATYDSDWLTYTTSFYLTGLADGTYFIDYNSTDLAGNIEPTKTFAVILDNTPPTTIISIGDPKYVTEITYVTPDTPFMLEADDRGGSGLYSIAYRISNGTYNSGWLPYKASFNLTRLSDGVYTIEFNSTDNVQNRETTHATSVTLFHWNYVYQDTSGRGTTLKINLAHKFFQFTAPSKDYGIRKATSMRQSGRAIIINHFDSKLRLITISVDTKKDFCYAMAWDLQTRRSYLLIDKARIESQKHHIPFFSCIQILS